MPQLDFANRLAIYGYKGGVEDFDNILAVVWFEHGYNNTYSTVERFLCFPMDSVTFCNEVKTLLKIHMRDDEILQRLMQLRKNKFLQEWRCLNP